MLLCGYFKVLLKRKTWSVKCELEQVLLRDGLPAV